MSLLRPRFRRTAAAVGLAASLLGAALAGTSVAAPTAPAALPAPASTPGLSEFGACLSGHGQGSVVLLVDQSGSMRQTDPDQGRVKAATYLVDRLSSFAGRSGVTLDVRVAGFADDYHPVGDWTTLTASTKDAVSASVRTVGADLRDYDTDYWNALNGARQDLVDHDSSGCRAVAWLSDGEFDLDVRDSDTARHDYGETKGYATGADLSSESGVQQAEQAGRGDLCRPTGLADQVRSSGVTLIGIGLSGPGPQPDFTLMRRVSQGGGSNAAAAGLEQCGNVSSPSGVFYPVSSLDTLLMAFDSVSTPGDTVQSQSVSICQGSACSAGEFSFVLDGTLDAVHVMASSDAPGLDAYLYAPGATQPLVVKAGQSSPAGTGVDATWLTPGTFQADLDSTKVPTWDGQWRLAFVDPSSASQNQQIHVNVHLSSPLTLSWTDLDKAELRQGESVGDVNLALLDHVGGQAVPASRVKGSVTMSVSLKDSAGNEHELWSGTDVTALGAPVTVALPPDTAIGSATLTTSVTVTTASTTLPDGSTVPGTALTPTEAAQDVTVLAPVNFPAVTGQAAFPTLEDELSGATELTVSGPGCVWLSSGEPTLTGAPADAGSVSVSSPASSPDTCVKVADGATATLPVTLAVQGHANGALSGTLAVTLAPDDAPDRAQTVQVPFSAEMRRPLNVATTWTTFVLVLLAGVLIPLALLYVLKFLTGRIPRGPLDTATRVVEVPAQGGAVTIRVPSNEVTMLSLRGRSRQLTVGSYEFRVRTGLLPTSAPTVELVSPDVPSVCGADPGARRGHAVLPLGVRGNWVAVLDQPDSPRHVTVVALAATSKGNQALQQVLDDAGRHLADRVASIAPQDAGQGDDAGSQDPGFGSGSGSTGPSTSSASFGTGSSGSGFGSGSTGWGSGGSSGSSSSGSGWGSGGSSGSGFGSGSTGWGSGGSSGSSSGWGSGAGSASSGSGWGSGGSTSSSTSSGFGSGASGSGWGSGGSSGTSGSSGWGSGSASSGFGSGSGSSGPDPSSGFGSGSSGSGWGSGSSGTTPPPATF